MDCGRAPGQFGHEAQDSAWLGAHKIDWFKSDSCYAKDRGEPGDKGHIDAIHLYELMRDGFNKSGYPVWWALCGWSPWCECALSLACWLACRQAHDRYSHLPGLTRVFADAHKSDALCRAQTLARTNTQGTQSATPLPTPRGSVPTLEAAGRQCCRTCRVSTRNTVTVPFTSCQIKWSEPDVSAVFLCVLSAGCGADAIPVQQFAGPHDSGGYWNDGCLLLTPGTGCHGEGVSVTTATPSDNCMTNDRFQSMYALWTILSFNLLLSGDFANLNPFVMATWTNDLAVGIK